MVSEEQKENKIPESKKLIFVGGIGLTGEILDIEDFDARLIPIIKKDKEGNFEGGDQEVEAIFESEEEGKEREVKGSKGGKKEKEGKENGGGQERNRDR